jgi:hypothetical protein
VKKVAFVTVLCLFLMPAAALADTVDFNAPVGGTGNNWTWNGTTVTGSSGANAAGPSGCWNTASCNPTVGLSFNGVDLSPWDWLGGSTLSFTSGTSTGTVVIGGVTYYTFAAGGTITVSDDAYSDCGGVDCFSGTFTNGQLAVDTTNGDLHFTGDFVGGTISPTLMGFLNDALGGNG